MGNVLTIQIHPKLDRVLSAGVKMIVKRGNKLYNLCYDKNCTLNFVFGGS